MNSKSPQIAATIAVTFSAFIVALMLAALNVALPMIQREFSVDAVTLTWITTAFILSSAVFLILVGKIADIVGRKKIFLLGIVVFSVSTLAAGFSRSVVVLIAFRILQGIGSAMINSTTMALLSSVFPANKRGTAIGIGTASTYMGLSFGPFLGGILTSALGWRWIFFFVAPLGIVPLITTVFFIREEWADARGEPYDLPGGILYAFSLSFFMYGITLLPAPRGLYFLLPGLAGLILFVRHEAAAGFPLFDVNLFRHNRVFAFSSAASLIHYAATFAITFLLSLYLQVTLKISPQLTGLILATQPIAQAALSPIAGRISDRVEPSILVSTGMGVTAAGLFLLSFLDGQSSILYIVLVLFMLGCGYAFFSSPNTNAIMSSVEKKHYGLASGTVSTMRSLGQVLSMCVTSIVFSVFIGAREIGETTLPEFGRSVRVSLLIFTAFCAAGVYFSAVRGNLARDKAASKS